MSYKDIINRKKKEWDCPTLMDGAHAARGDKIPFSSPLLSYCTYGGVPRNKITEFYGEPSGGKAQPLSSKILTPTGWVNMGDIKVGDEVFDGAGNICTVDGVFPQGDKKVYKIGMSDETSFRVSDEHLNAVTIYDGYKLESYDAVLTTEELINEIYESFKDAYIDIPKLNWDEKPIKINPYLMGFLIGVIDDNCRSIKRIDSVFNDFAKYLSDCYKFDTSEVLSLYDDLIKSNGGSIESAFKSIYDMDLKSCHIPNEFLMNSIKTRMDLFHGICDAKEEYDMFDFNSKDISEGFTFLVRSLGVYDICQPDFKSISHMLTSPFDNSKKLIEEIQPDGYEPCQCIHVTSDLHTYITDGFNITHNTTTAVDICKNAIEIFKQEHENKIQELRERTSTSKALAAELESLQELGPKKVIYIDLEHSFDGAWADTLGIAESDIDIMQPPNVEAEEVLQTIEELICTGEVGLVVLDSLASLVPRSELEKKYGERTVAALAGLLTIFMRKIVALLTRYETTLITINQTRDNMDNPYVIKTPGGQAPKFYASLRMYFRIGHPVDFLGNELPNNTENPAGYIVNAKITKQKSAPNDRKNGSYYLMTNSGIREDIDFAQLALKKYDLIHKSGGWYTLVKPTGEVLEDEDGNPIKVQGLAKVYDFLQSNRDYYEELKTFIMDDINGKSAEDVVNEAGEI